jgi:hypothetical protein
MGFAPFRFVGVFTIPSPEANPAAYENAMRQVPPFHCGTCAHCGQGIMNNYLVISADGQKSSVGCDCIMKIRAVDPALAKRADQERLKIERQKRREIADAKREARRAAWLDANAERLAREAAERAAREEAARAERLAAAQATIARWGFMLPLLGSSPWTASIADSIRNGAEPRGRAVEILRDNYARSHGRRGSNAFAAACDDFDARTAS